MSHLDKKEFFEETRHAVGKTALVLSGGAILGMYHIGVIKTLFEERMLPKIISGSSAGSLVAAFTCAKKDSELLEYLGSEGVKFDAFLKKDPRGSVVRKLQRLLN